MTTTLLRRFMRGAEPGSGSAKKDPKPGDSVGERHRARCDPELDRKNKQTNPIRRNRLVNTQLHELVGRVPKEFKSRENRNAQATERLVGKDRPQTCHRIHIAIGVIDHGEVRVARGLSWDPLENAGVPGRQTQDIQKRKETNPILEKLTKRNRIPQKNRTRCQSCPDYSDVSSVYSTVTDFARLRGWST